MRRRRLPTRRSKNVGLVQRSSNSDFRFLEQVVCIPFPADSGRLYLQRNMANQIGVRLVEAGRGETSGTIRCVEVKHASGNQPTWVGGIRVLANGSPASFFVPDHLVSVVSEISGSGAENPVLSVDDTIILHVPVHGYLRYLPQIFQGAGPVSSRRVTQTRDAALERWGSQKVEQSVQEDTFNGDPLRRFLFVFQHVMNSVTDRIDKMADLTNPSLCESKFLPWLASWVNFELDQGLPLHQQRELVRRAIRLQRTKGTRRGIEEMVRVLTSAPVRVQERARPRLATLGKMHLIGGRGVVERYRRADPPGCYLVEPNGRPSTGYFVLILEPHSRFRTRFGERASSVLRRIVQVVSQERPTHIVFTIEFDEQLAHEERD